MELQHNCVCAIIIYMFLEFTFLIELYWRMRLERGDFYISRKSISVNSC